MLQKEHCGKVSNKFKFDDYLFLVFLFKGKRTKIRL